MQNLQRIADTIEPHAPQHKMPAKQWRELARRLRVDGAPPIRIVSDGTVF